MTAASKVIVKVSWGIIPELEEGAWWESLTNEQVNDGDSYDHLMGIAIAKALIHANPTRFNWMKLEWTWL